MGEQKLTRDEIYELIEIFGLTVDYDQWDVEGKEWVRVISNDYGAEFGNNNKCDCIIIYKDDGKKSNINELRESLIELGQNINAKRVRKLLNLE